ncbi:hypothetical protein IDJ77_12430 [Mucilaginibacter sp. ZT4R22]|uniref:Lipoprotein n=1 Tax=Mucilaginibacter pankratovii TaxID=2772110 RepID=A0ABR7WQL1_9SPHI|nr:hypothetical protein [Mucilaginibacter pankratovii]MBD1364618.1 hypothetical protein [Mucilaginibacter pankratovii]
MNRPALFILAIALITLGACNSNKPKPVSDTLAKTAVTVNGKKDSVINNPQNNYGNATIAELCVKCLIEIVKADDNYKKAAVPENDVKFIINYVKTVQPQDTVSEVKATNALRVDVINKMPAPHKISSFLYDNNLAKVYFLIGNTKTELKTDASLLKRVRNSCYWGVASGK